MLSESFLTCLHRCTWHQQRWEFWLLLSSGWSWFTGACKSQPCKSLPTPHEQQQTGNWKSTTAGVLAPWKSSRTADRRVLVRRLAAHSCSSSWPTLDAFSLFHSGLPGRCVQASRFGFILPLLLPDDAGHLFACWLATRCPLSWSACLSLLLVFDTALTFSYTSVAVFYVLWLYKPLDDGLWWFWWAKALLF